MNKLALALVSGYQAFISPLLHMIFGASFGCRYSVTCSQYAKSAIKKYGIVAAFPLIVIRIVSCQPFSGKKETYI